VKTAAPAYAQTYARELVAGNVNTGRVGTACGRNAEFRRQVDDTLFQGRHQRSHPHGGSPKVEQRVDHELARPVKRNLTAAVNPYDRDVAGREQVFLAGVQTHGKYRRVFREPDFITGRIRTRIREALHRMPQRNVILPSEIPNRDHVIGDAAHSAIKTSS
jgi:hypothetical protein